MHTTFIYETIGINKTKKEEGSNFINPSKLQHNSNKKIQRGRFKLGNPWSNHIKP